jgi:hypothetical protein
MIYNSNNIALSMAQTGAAIFIVASLIAVSGQFLIERIFAQNDKNKTGSILNYNLKKISLFIIFAVLFCFHASVSPGLANFMHEISENKLSFIVFLFFNCIISIFIFFSMFFLIWGSPFKFSEGSISQKISRLFLFGLLVSFFLFIYDFYGLLRSVIALL